MIIKTTRKLKAFSRNGCAQKINNHTESKARSECRSRTKHSSIRCRYLQNVLPHHPCNPYFLKTRLHKRILYKLCNRCEKQSFTDKKNSFSLTLCYDKRFFSVRCLQRFSAVSLRAQKTILTVPTPERHNLNRPGYLVNRRHVGLWYISKHVGKMQAYLSKKLLTHLRLQGSSKEQCGEPTALSFHRSGISCGASKGSPTQLLHHARMEAEVFTKAYPCTPS